MLEDKHEIRGEACHGIDPVVRASAMPADPDPALATAALATAALVTAPRCFVTSLLTWNRGNGHGCC